jgi:5''-3'' exonuclease (including N-terminal domain of PolI)
VPSNCFQSTKQSHDDQGGFIANDDDEVVLKKSHNTQDEIEVSSTDSFTDVNVPSNCLQSTKPLVDKTQLHEHRAFKIDTSNHIPDSAPKTANKESPIMIADSAMSINQHIDGQHKNEDICYQSISSCKHSNKRETFERGALNDEPDMVLKVSNTESFAADSSTADSVESYNPCIDGQHKGEGTSDVLISRCKYSTCQENNQESRSSCLQGKDDEEEGDEDDDDDVDWEDGEDTTKDITLDDFESCHDVIEDTRDFNKSHAMHDSYGTPTISKKRVRSCDYNDMEHYQIQTLNTEVGHHDNASIISEKKDNNNANAAALLSAHATASQLTDWAGRVVRKAIQMHLGEQVDEKIQARIESTESDSITPSEDEAVHNNQSDESPSGDISTKSQAYDLREFVDTSLEALQRQDDILRDEDNRRERDMDTVTEEMIEDVILLLTLFGIPYLRAPAEAEAQAVELEKLGLVDGVVTEDSDAIVFGSRSVYRNIFDDKKYVELYLSSDSEAIGLGYNEKIALAMLLGGDYTQGVKGVGIVNGMEILKAFPVAESVLGGLNAFRNWLDGFELDNTTNSDNPNLAEFTKKHKSARSRWLLPSNFPSNIVWQAYTKPVVDNSQTNFSWGVPDVDAIRIFLSKKVGWEVAEINRIILPVTKAMAEAKTQKRIDGYFMRSEDNIKFADVRSKRLRRVWELDKRNNSETEDD